MSNFAKKSLEEDFRKEQNQNLEKFSEIARILEEEVKPNIEHHSNIIEDHEERLAIIERIIRDLSEAFQIREMTLLDKVVEEIEVRMVAKPELKSVLVQVPNEEQEEVMKRRMLEDLKSKRLLYLRKTPKDIFTEKLMRDRYCTYEEAEELYLQEVEERLRERPLRQSES